MRAGAQVIVEVLASQSRARSAAEGGVRARRGARAAARPRRAGAGPARRRRSPAVGRTLAELDLRGLTGATVLAITRGEQGVVVPTAHEVLPAGDVLALAGTHDAVERRDRAAATAATLAPKRPSTRSRSTAERRPLVAARIRRVTSVTVALSPVWRCSITAGSR